MRRPESKARFWNRLIHYLSSARDLKTCRSKLELQASRFEQVCSTACFRVPCRVRVPHSTIYFQLTGSFRANLYVLCCLLPCRAQAEKEGYACTGPGYSECFYEAHRQCQPFEQLLRYNRLTGAFSTPAWLVFPATLIACYAHVQTLLHYSYFWNFIDPYLNDLAPVRPSVGGFILRSLRHLHTLIMEPPPPAALAAVPAGASKLELKAAANAAKAAKATAFAAARNHADAVQQAYYDVMHAAGKFSNPRGLDFELRCGLADVGPPMPQPCSLALPECLLFLRCAQVQATLRGTAPF